MPFMCYTENYILGFSVPESDRILVTVGIYELQEKQMFIQCLCFRSYYNRQDHSTNKDYSAE